MKKILLLVYVICISAVCFAETDKKADLEKQVVNLKEEVDKLKESNKEMSSLYENKFKNTEKELVLKAEDYKMDVKREISKTWFLLVVFIVGGLSGVVTMFFAIPKFTQKKVMEEISQIISINREDILSIIQRNEFLSELKNKKKIIVLSAQKSSDNELQVFFSNPRFRFKKITYHTCEEININEEVANSDLVILNNQDGDFLKYKEFVKSDGKTFFLYYNVTNVRADVTNNRRFNFANSTSTLFPRIIETLETQDALNS